jgi:hypothetical protein
VTVTTPRVLRSARAAPASAMSGQTAVPMDAFKWIVSGLLGTLLVCIGWFLNDMRDDLRDIRKDVTAIRVDAAATNARLGSLIEEGRQRLAR